MRWTVEYVLTVKYALINTLTSNRSLTVLKGVDRRFHTTSSISSSEVSSLDHEVLNHAVELAALVTESFLLRHKSMQCNFLYIC